MISWQASTQTSTSKHKQALRQASTQASMSFDSAFLLELRNILVENDRKKIHFRDQMLGDVLTNENIKEKLLTAALTGRNYITLWSKSLTPEEYDKMASFMSPFTAFPVVPGSPSALTVQNLQNIGEIRLVFNPNFRIPVPKAQLKSRSSTSVPFLFSLFVIFVAAISLVLLSNLVL